MVYVYDLLDQTLIERLRNLVVSTIHSECVVQHTTGAISDLLLDLVQLYVGCNHLAELHRPKLRESYASC